VDLIDEFVLIIHRTGLEIYEGRPWHRSLRRDRLFEKEYGLNNSQSLADANLRAVLLAKFMFLNADSARDSILSRPIPSSHSTFASNMKNRAYLILVTVTTVAIASSAVLAQQPSTDFGHNRDNVVAPNGEASPSEDPDWTEDRETDSFFRDSCESRGTLLQWSIGTSFSGGPDLDEPLVTDRPDFTEASSTVGLGVAQLEIGYTYTFDNDGTTSTRSHSSPEPLLRYGVLADWLELRVGWNYADQVSGGVQVSGSEDLYLGFKIGLTPQEHFLPEMALIPQMTVPTGASPFSADEVLPGLNWVYAWEIDDCISTAGSTQFNRAIDEGSAGAYTEWAQSWTVAYSLSDRVGAYTEWFAFFPHSSDTEKPEHYFNGGFTYLISDDVQWDIRAGAGLNDAADDYFVGTGLSIRVR